MYIKTYFLNQCNKARFTNLEKQNNENFGCKAKVQNYVGEWSEILFLISFFTLLLHKGEITLYM